MTQNKIFKKMLDFQKAGFDNSYNAMTMMRGQGEKFVDNIIDSSPLLPNEGKKAMKDWNSACRKGSEEFKEMVDNNFKKAEEYLLGKQGKTGSKTKNAP